MAAVAGWCRDSRVAVLAGGRLSDEDAYALSKLARTALKTNDVDHRLAPSDPDALPAERAQAAGMPVTYQDVERAKAIVVVGLDAEQELPILHLRIRKAARAGARVFVIHPRRTRLHDVAVHLLCRPGAEASLLADLGDREPGSALESALREAGEGAVVLAGPRLAESPGAIAAAASLASASGGRFALVCRRANDRGALVAGLHPALLPGGRAVTDDAARAGIEDAWAAPVPGEPGRDTRAILEAAADREIDVLFLVGTDPLRDHPDAALARRALENVLHKVVVDIDGEAMRIYADVMLPAAPAIEKDGHYTDWEGRSQRLRPVRNPAGLARSEWQIFQELSEIAGKDMGFHSLEDLHEEMARVLHPSAVSPDRHGVAASSEDRADTAPVSAESLLLFTYPLLVDEGRLSWGADTLKRALEEQPFIEVNPADAERLGLAEGSTARVKTDAGQATLPVRVTASVVEGAVFVPWNQPGLAANTLLSGRSITPVVIEPADESEAAG
jgi:NADH-quinone oxidoreductase subunit G